MGHGKKAVQFVVDYRLGSGGVGRVVSDGAAGIAGMWGRNLGAIGCAMPTVSMCWASRR